MAHIDTGGGGKRRSNIELNLVPFIDLMSVLITFLLITAVWSQVSMLQIGSSVYGKKSEGVTPQITPDLDIVLRLDINENGYLLTVGTEQTDLPKRDGQFDTKALFDQLSSTKARYPNKIDAIIRMADQLAYQDLVKGMDFMLQAGFPQIAIATGAPKNAH